MMWCGESAVRATGSSGGHLRGRRQVTSIVTRRGMSLAHCRLMINRCEKRLLTKAESLDQRLVSRAVNTREVPKVA